MMNFLRQQLPLKFKYRIHLIEKFLDFQHVKSTLYSKRQAPNIETFYHRLQPFDSEFPLIRVGGARDGGYLLPDSRINWDAIVSPGVGGSIAFESELASPETQVFLIDGTIDPIENLPINFHFLPKMLVSGDADSSSINLAELIADSRIKGSNLLLQMDIEGSEWEIFASTSVEILDKFKIIVVELHDLDRLLDSAQYFKMVGVIDKILENHFVTHVHINNAGSFYFHKYKKYPKVVEVTLLKRNTFTQGLKSVIPHKLDKPSDLQIYDWKYTV